MGGDFDWATVSHERRVHALASIRRQRAEIDARETQVLAVMAADPPPSMDGSPALNKQWVREDVSCALRVSPNVAADKLYTAHQVANRLPATLAAMRAGGIDARHAHRLAEATNALPDRAASKVERRVLKRAGCQTLAQFSASVRRAVLAADPRSADARHRDAVAERRVVFTAQNDGVTELWAMLPVDQATALQSRIQQEADRCKGLDERTADQRRADALCAFATASDSSGPGLRPAVNVTVAASTLLGLDDQPADLAGHGPIAPALARAIAFDPSGTWRRLLADTDGQTLDYGRRTYRPPVRLRELVTARDTHCTFPTCMRVARCCDLDHLLAWEDGGTTSAENLHPLCPRHHRLKHETRWRVRRQCDGTTRWTSPTGRCYDKPPPERSGDNLPPPF